MFHQKTVGKHWNGLVPHWLSAPPPHFFKEISSLLEDKDAVNTFSTSAHKFTTFSIFTCNSAIKPWPSATWTRLIATFCPRVPVWVPGLDRAAPMESSSHPHDRRHPSSQLWPEHISLRAICINHGRNQKEGLGRRGRERERDRGGGRNKEIRGRMEKEGGWRERGRERNKGGEKWEAAMFAQFT